MPNHGNQKGMGQSVRHILNLVNYGIFLLVVQKSPRYCEWVPDNRQARHHTEERHVKTARLHAGVAAALVMLAGSAFADEEVNEILAKIQKANDPAGAMGGITSEVIQSRIKVDSAKEGQMTLRIQYPGKMRIDAEGKDEKLIRGFNGEQGWQYSTKDGLREITGAELASMRFHVLFAMPDTNFAELFEQVVLAGEETVRGRACHTLTCTPRAAYQMPPLTLYVDKQSHLVAKSVERHNLKDGLVEITKTYDAYEDFAASWSRRASSPRPTANWST